MAMASLVLISMFIFAFCDAAFYLSNTNITEICEIKEDSCEVYFDSKKIEGLLENEPDSVTIIDNEEFNTIKQSCFLSSRFWNNKYGFIYPGTLWCGRGTKADNYTQLGVHSKEDSCCREHDNCPNSLVSGQCKAGICNKSRITRSHCDCDRKFQQCLQNSATETGNLIGAIFFNIAQIFCIREIPRCPERARVLVDQESRILSCPYEFSLSDKYIFSTPFYTVKNRKAYYVNMVLRKLSLGKK
ncbi:hypothetical protein AMK59_1320 [Oryctes borbonicus]|uniref:phospholipase A2 n=1 Tax=Oryctes borbonicus TaxID=1629725 RepID=A0A0T6B9W9_9SCAR|nr:hypothetical protein AMK59_1320 [Oryctes borbonicus]